MRKLILMIMLMGLFQSPANAELTLLEVELFTGSEESFSRRTYSYDFDVTPQGTVHAVYSKPVPNEERSQVIYVTKPVGGDWPSDGQRIVLEEFGSKESISTWIMLDANGVAHISYIVERDFVDQNGTTHAHGLVYQTVNNGVVSAKTNVSAGSFHTRMQLSKNNKAMFAREIEIFWTERGTIRERPFPKGLQISVPSVSEENTWQNFLLDLPNAVDYRLANFLYEAERNRFHITYGDQDAGLLRDTYPSTNPPVTLESTPVPFPAGTGHKLWYTFSDNVLNAEGTLNDAPTWKTSVIDASGNISENEFWTDLILDNDHTPFIASYRYATDEQGIQQGTSNIVGHFNGQSWEMQTVAGRTSGASEHRAGMGPKLLVDAAGGFHAIWDNSPDKPIDGENRPIAGQVAGGTTMYRYSPDGTTWGPTRQIILPFSVEGNCRAKLHNGKLLLMVLGDARDAKVVFAEYALPAPSDELLEVSSDKMFYGAGEAMKLHARIQGSSLGDLYVVVGGPYHLDEVGNLVPVSTTFQFSYLTSDLTWQPFSDFATIQPVLGSFPLGEYNVDFAYPVARSSAPFANPARYVIYSVVNAPGQPLGSFLTPIYSYEVHVCDQVACGEL